MKKTILSGIIMGAMTFMSQSVMASAWCSRPDIQGYTGSCYTDGIAKITDNNTKLIGFANRRNQIIIPTQYTDADNYSQGLIAVKHPNQDNWGMIDLKQQIIIPFDYQFLNSPSTNGHIRAKRNHQWAYIDRNQKEIISFGRYDMILPLGFDGFIQVQKNGKWGYTDKNGNEIIKPQYDNANYFTRNVVCITKDGKHGCINKQGQEVVPFIYDNIEAFTAGKYRNKIVATLNGQTFYFNKNGRAIAR